MKSIIIVGSLIVVPYAKAAMPWGNCAPVAQSEPIVQEFWKSDTNGSSGPDYNLKSGHVFSNAGNLCRQGKPLDSNEWIKELKTKNSFNGLNPVKSITHFRAIQSPREFLELLSKHKIDVPDSNNLQNAVGTFLGIQPSPDQPMAASGSPRNPAIIVGESVKELLIMLATSDEKDQAATLMTIKKK